MEETAALAHAESQATIADLVRQLQRAEEATELALSKQSAAERHARQDQTAAKAQVCHARSSWLLPADLLQLNPGIAVITQSPSFSSWLEGVTWLADSGTLSMPSAHTL